MGSRSALLNHSSACPGHARLHPGTGHTGPLPLQPLPQSRGAPGTLLSCPTPGRVRTAQPAGLCPKSSDDPKALGAGCQTGAVRVSLGIPLFRAPTVLGWELVATFPCPLLPSPSLVSPVSPILALARMAAGTAALHQQLSGLAEPACVRALPGNDYKHTALKHLGHQV